MFKLWVKLYEEEKIIKQFIYQKNELLVYSKFLDYLMEICYEMDIPTPVILKTHIFSLAKFSLVTFKAKDFIESIDFDKMVIEKLKV